jgi:hypothetical protein
MIRIALLLRVAFGVIAGETCLADLSLEINLKLQETSEARPCFLGARRFDGAEFAVNALLFFRHNASEHHVILS